MSGSFLNNAMIPTPKIQAPKILLASPTVVPIAQPAQPASVIVPVSALGGSGSGATVVPKVAQENPATIGAGGGVNTGIVSVVPYGANFKTTNSQKSGGNAQAFLPTASDLKNLQSAMTPQSGFSWWWILLGVLGIYLISK